MARYPCLQCKSGRGPCITTIGPGFDAEHAAARALTRSGSSTGRSRKAFRRVTRVRRRSLAASPRSRIRSHNDAVGKPTGSCRSRSAWRRSRSLSRCAGVADPGASLRPDAPCFRRVSLFAETESQTTPMPAPILVFRLPIIGPAAADRPATNYCGQCRALLALIVSRDLDSRDRGARNTSSRSQDLHQRAGAPLALVLIVVVEQHVRRVRFGGQIRHRTADLGQLLLVVVVIEALR